MYCDLMLVTPRSIDLAAEANAYYDSSKGCRFEYGFDLIDLHVSIVWLSVDPKHGAACDNDVGAREEMVFLRSQGRLIIHRPRVFCVECGPKALSKVLSVWITPKCLRHLSCSHLAPIFCTPRLGAQTILRKWEHPITCGAVND